MAENSTFTFGTSVQAKMGCHAPDTLNMEWNIASWRNPLFLKNGYLKVENHYFHPDEYCINGKNENTLKISVCPQNCEGPRPCIVKCCGLHQVYNIAFTRDSPKRGCHNLVPEEGYFNPKLFKDFDRPRYFNALAPHYIEKYPSTFKYECHENITTILLPPRTSQIISNFTPFNFSGHTFIIKKDGKIQYRELDGGCSILDEKVSHFCVDGLINFTPEFKQFHNDPEDLVILLCADPPIVEEEESKETEYFYGGFMIILSSIVLLITILVHFLLWGKQTVNNWTILSCNISLFFMYIFFGTSHVLKGTNNPSLLNTPSCFAIGVLSHFFSLSSPCWLSVISLDLWLSFRAKRMNLGFHCYTLYSILALGIPFIIVSNGLMLTTEHSELSCSPVITPGYGIQSCYLQEKALGAYLYYPIAAIIGLTILLFLIPFITLYRIQSFPRMANVEEFYRLFSQLFFVTGMFYVFELISWALFYGVYWYWVTLAVLNILRAVAIFIIFVCKADILWAIERNYPALKPILIPFACITRKKRMVSLHNAVSETVGFNSQTQQTILRS